MTPGPVEEVGKVATGIVSALASQPLALALVIMNLCLLGLFYLIMDRTDRHNLAREEAARLEQKEIRELMSKCIVPTGDNK